MRVSRATVPTESAQSYMRKLGQHWSHRFPVAFEGDDGCKIEMPKALCELRAQRTYLSVELMLQDEEDQERLENVLEEHLKRFAFREQLQFVWEHAQS